MGVRSASRASSTPAPQVLKQEIEFPPSAPPADVPGAESLSFWEHVYDVPENQWASETEKGYRVYLYDHDSPGSKYLAVIFHPFDIEWIKQTYGGGRYRAQLNDSSGRIVSKDIFSIDGESKRKPPQSVQNSTAPPQPNDNFSSLIQMMREEQQETRKLFREMLDRNSGAAPAPAAIDPNVALRGVVEIFSGLVTRAAAPPQPQMGLLEMVALIEKFKGPDLIEQMKAMKEAGLIPSSSGGGSLVTQFKELKEAAEVVGLGEGKGKSLGEAVIEKLPDILHAGGEALDKYQKIENTRLETARHVRAIQQQRNGVVVPPQPAAPAGQVPQHTGAQPQQYAQQPPLQTSGIGLEVEAPGTPPTAEQIAQAEQQMNFVKGKIVELIAEGQSGGDIIDFLDNIDKKICDQFAGASADQLAKFFADDPVLKKAVPLPRFKAAIAEIVQELNGPDETMETVRPN